MQIEYNSSFMPIHYAVGSRPLPTTPCRNICACLGRGCCRSASLLWACGATPMLRLGKNILLLALSQVYDAYNQSVILEFSGEGGTLVAYNDTLVREARSTA